MIRPTDDPNEEEPELVLRRAMQESPPSTGYDLLALLRSWFSISSANQPGLANPLRFPFLKWAVQGRAREILTWLEGPGDSDSAEIAEEIRRIADLPFPPRNERAQQAALEMRAWLKVELYGSTDGPTA